MAPEIVLQFVKQDNLPSDLIAYFSHGAGFSHVDAVMLDGRLLGARHDVRSGIPAGVQIRPPNYADFARTLRVTLPATDAQVRAFWDFLELQIGKPYDTEAILGFVVGRDWRKPNAWICSEADGAALESVDWFPHDLATPANKLTPDDLLLAISARIPVNLDA
ncbi:MAG TPA: hypothetical protein VMV19_17800 [Xanthobacteraceae bacterium]|nr:hypothetical protein [Xanthobacteraceae bacterium]